MTATGTRIDRYEVESSLGAGGFGSVYLARHTVLGTRVALKVLDARHSATPGMVERFLREAQLAAGIGNPHIVAVSDAGVTADGLPFLAMEVLEGEDLEARLRRSGPLPPYLAIDVTLQVLTGLGAAHYAGIVHRDMKPANVFLTRGPDGKPFAKILDFGISKVIDPTRASQLTGTGLTLGTPAYMAPEQLANTSGVDHRADLYAVGAILFEALTGQLPYPAETLSDLMQRVQGRPPDRLERHLPGAPPALGAFLQRALAVAPEHRFGNAQEMTGALRQIRAQVPADAHVPTPALGAWPSQPVAPPPSQPMTPPPAAAFPVAPAPAASSSRGLFVALAIAALLLPLVCIFTGGVTWFLSGTDEPPSTVAAPTPAPTPSPPSTPAPRPSPSIPPRPTAPEPPPMQPEATGPPQAVAIPEDAEPCAVPVQHEVECDRRWDQQIPTDCEVRRGMEMHLLGSYEPARGEGEAVQVDIARTVAPIVLVLSSYADITWELRLAEGVEIEEVHLVGRGNARVEGLPPGVQARQGRGYPIMGWEWEDDMGIRTNWTGRETAIRAERELRHPMRAYAGCYNPTRFFIGQSAPR